MNISDDLLMAQAVLRKVRKELARRLLLAFIQFTMPAFQVAAHHRLIASALQRVIEGSLKRLYIGMPPRHGKSEMASVRFAAFYLGRYPDKQIIHISYAAALSNEFSRQVRRIIREDENYRLLFPHVRLDPDRERLDDWKLVQGGGFKSVGVQGGVTGHGADLMIIDDPHKEGDAESPAVLDAIFVWYATAARTRLAPGAAIVFVMTRWHPRDLMGRLLELERDDPEADRWEQLVLPALAGENDPLGRLPGEALWAERYSAGALRALRAISERLFDALYQQNPRAMSKEMFKRSGFQVVGSSELKKGAWCFDLALTQDERNDYTTAERWEYNEETGALLLTHIIRKQQEWPDTKKLICELIELYPEDDFVFPPTLLEMLVVQELRVAVGSNQHRIKALLGTEYRGDKVARAQVLADRCENDKVFVVYGENTEVFICELCEFPAGEHDDLVDSSSVATHWFGLRAEFDALVAALDQSVEEPTTDMMRRWGE